MSTVLLLPPLKYACLCLPLFFLESLILFFRAATTPHEFLITGDFDLHLDSQLKQFLAALDSTNLTQHVSFLHIAILLSLPLLLLLVLTLLLTTHLSRLLITYLFSLLSILTSIPLPLTQTSFHCFTSISVFKFTRDILYSRLITHLPPNLSDLVDAYNFTLTSLIDIHAPLKTKTIRAKSINKWYTPALSALKSSPSSPGKPLASHSLTSSPQTPSYCL